jgi:hypothetical protein
MLVPLYHVGNLHACLGYSIRFAWSVPELNVSCPKEYLYFLQSGTARDIEYLKRREVECEYANVMMVLVVEMELVPVQVGFAE